MKIPSPDELRTKTSITDVVVRKMRTQPEAEQHVVDLVDPDDEELAALLVKLGARGWKVDVAAIEGGQRITIGKEAPPPPGLEHHVIVIARKSPSLPEAARRLMMKPGKVADFITARGLVVADVIGSNV